MLHKITNVIKNFNEIDFYLLIFFVTNKCNLSCKTCFYWDKLNKGVNLSFEQIRKLTKQLPSFKQLIISGGEPFLREDLPAVVKEFIDNCGVQEVDIPTNGLLTERILAFTEEIVSKNPKRKFVVSVSWDGLEEVNDTIRLGTRQSGDIVETIKKIVALSKSYKNLEIQINTVICKENYLKIADFITYLENNDYFGITRHLFEIIRGIPRQKEESRFSPAEFKELKGVFAKIINYQDRMFKNGLKNKSFLARYILAGFNYVNLGAIYKLQYNYFVSAKKWPFCCASGYGMTAVIEHDGDIRLCELRKKIGNIKDNDFNKLFNSEEARNERKEIIDLNCSCSHLCFIYPSLYHNIKMVFLKLPFEYLKYLIGLRAW